MHSKNLLNAESKRFLFDTLKWIGIYFAIAAVVSWLVDFPYSLIIIIAVVFGLGAYRRRRLFRRMGARNASFGSMFGQRGVAYYCMNCGVKHNQAACPNCGSKLKKAGF